MISVGLWFSSGYDFRRVMIFVGLWFPSGYDFRRVMIFVVPILFYHHNSSDKVIFSAGLAYNILHSMQNYTIRRTPQCKIAVIKRSRSRKAWWNAVYSADIWPTRRAPRTYAVANSTLTESGSSAAAAISSCFMRPAARHMTVPNCRQPIDTDKNRTIFTYCSRAWNG